MNKDKILIYKITNIVIILSALFWLLLAIINYFSKLSVLQINWSYEAKLVIFLFFPVVIFAGLITQINNKIKVIGITNSKNDKKIIYLFYIIYIIFLFQCLYSTPPGLSENQNIARLDWGIKYLHLITEVIIRIALINCLSISICNEKFDRNTKYIILLSLIYSYLVVTRSFLIEIAFYAIVTKWIIYLKQGGNIFNYKTISGFLILIFVFVVYGNIRQGEQFSITEYAMIDIDSSFLGWIFGYFLINYDNLALIINENYHNNAFTNVFGSILQTLQISEFVHVDDYLYVGRFNIGTALRPYILDYGYILGTLFFGLVWIIFLVIPRFSLSISARYSCLLLISYIALCFPITSRLEQPPYLFPFIFFTFIKDIRSKKRNLSKQ